MSFSLSVIKSLKETTYENWYESLTINFVIINLDLALRIDTPVELINESFANIKTHYEQWVHSNRTCLMIMMYTIGKSIRQSITDTDNSTKEYLDAVENKFTEFDNSKIKYG